MLAFIEGVFSQESTPYPLLYDQFFPANLYCSELNTVSQGPTWQGIKVGVSRLEDLQSYLATLSPNYKHGYPIPEFPDMALSALSILREGQERQIPTAIKVCIKNGIIASLTISLPLPAASTYEGALYIDDVLARYGVPDAVSWSDAPGMRLLFWFDEGLGIDVVGTTGLVIAITYFAYQTNSYENEWPFKYVRPAHLPPEFFTDEDPTKLNPFDFESMMLTITTEPSRTPTATMMPYSTNTPTSNILVTATGISR